MQNNKKNKKKTKSYLEALARELTTAATFILYTTHQNQYKKAQNIIIQQVLCNIIYCFMKKSKKYVYCKINKTV